MASRFFDYDERPSAATDASLLPQWTDSEWDVLVGVAERMRFHAGSISVRNRRRQLRSKLRIQLKYFRPAEPFSFVGVAKTLILMSLPYGAVVAVKGTLARRTHG